MANLFTPKVIHKAQTEPAWIRKLDANHWRFVPQGSEHGIYILAVTFDKKGVPTVESCRDARTHKTCKGFRFTGGGCWHAAAISIHLVKPLLKKENAA